MSNCLESSEYIKMTFKSESPASVVFCLTGSYIWCLFTCPIMSGAKSVECSRIQTTNQEDGEC